MLMATLRFGIKRLFFADNALPVAVISHLMMFKRLPVTEIGHLAMLNFPFPKISIEK